MALVPTQAPSTALTYTHPWKLQPGTMASQAHPIPNLFAPSFSFFFDPTDPFTRFTSRPDDMFSLFTHGGLGDFGTGLKGILNNMSCLTGGLDTKTNGGEPWTMAMGNALPFDDGHGTKGTFDFRISIAHNGADAYRDLKDLDKEDPKTHTEQDFHTRTNGFGLSEAYKSNLHDLFSLMQGQNGKMRFYVGSDRPAMSSRSPTAALVGATDRPTIPDTATQSALPILDPGSALSTVPVCV